MRRIKLVLFHCVLAMALIRPAMAALTFSITPSAVSNTYTGAITLQIGGLTNGETVVIKKFLDLNTNGVIDANDPMVRDFQLTAGQSGAMVIGGVTNVNVPFNSSTSTNAITTTLNFQNGQIMDSLTGQYLFQASCVSGQITDSLAVTNSYPQQFTGTVLSGGNPVPNAVVLLLPASGKIDNAPTPGVVANNSGVYTLPAPAGTYALSAFKTNFVTGAAATFLSLTNGGTLATNLSLTAATESISGKIIDAATSNGLPGILVVLGSPGGLGLCYTDTNGNFSGGVTAGECSVNGENQAVALLGYVGFNNGLPVNATSGSVTNVVVVENKATALFYGHFTDNMGTPLAGFAVEAEDLNNVYDSFGSADANGYYVTGALASLGGGDTYEVNLASDFAPSNEVFTESPYNYGNGGTNLATNTAVMVNFTDILATNLITGWLKDNLGNPIAGVQVQDYDETPINGLFYQSQGAVTDPNGNYVLYVCNGTWDVYVDDFGGNFSLPTNYVSPSDKSVMSLNNNAVADFTATNLLVLQVTTATLPNGTNGFAYNQPLDATNGRSPYSWSLIAGSLPSGLTLGANGIISGTPTTDGAFNFMVKVTDVSTEAATQALTVTVGDQPGVAIQPTNGSVTVSVGSNVTFFVSVSGTGPFSYQWQLNGTNLPINVITTFAGNGTGGSSGDGTPATNAELFNPNGLAVDQAGNLFIADEAGYRIRKVATNGIIVTVAGNGSGGYSGDGGAATNAGIVPTGVAVDAFGNLFIADAGNNRIRKVGTNGIITTIAGVGCNCAGGDGGPATNAGLSSPNAVALDTNGNVFIADSGGALIHKVDSNGIITRVAGNGTQGYSGDGGAATSAELHVPMGVALDSLGNLFIADAENNRIRMVGTNGIITTVAGDGIPSYFGDGGAATGTPLNFPASLAVDPAGNLFIGDEDNERIRKVGTNGIITTVAGNGNASFIGDGGVATNAEFDLPDGVALDASGNLFIADELNQRVRKVSFPGPTLLLNGVGFGNTGAYDVVVASPYGSVTSSIVNLTVSLPPLVLSASQVFAGKSNFTFVLSGPAGSNYVLQVSTNLSNWSSISTSTIPVGGFINLTNSISGANHGFFRAYLQ